MEAELRAGVVAFAVALLVSPLVLSLLKGRIVDVPNQRSSHSTSTPRGGGIALIAGVLAGLGIAVNDRRLWLGVGAALVVGGLGLVEDIRGVGVKVRLAIQTGAALLAVALLLSLSDPVQPVILVSIVLGVFWLVGFTNAFNFMDGINGLSAAQLIVAGLAWVRIAQLSPVPALSSAGLVTVGAALGFLPWNFPRARFFMGDVGAYFSGCWIAFITLYAAFEGIPVLAALAPLVIYGTDTSITLIRRIRRREDWLSPHRSHIYQQLVIAGWSHTRTTAVLTCLAAGTSTGGILWMAESAAVAGLGVFVIAALTGLYVALPVVVDRQSQNLLQR